MTWSLNIRGGDINLAGQNGMDIVTGGDKLIQDLRCAFLEEMGTDPMHPDYGTLIDGGRLPDGTVVPSNFGEVINSTVIAKVEAEIRRVLEAYQRQQIRRLQEENERYNGQNSFSSGEILYEIEDVEIRQIRSTLIVRVGIRTGEGRTFNIVQPV